MIRRGSARPCGPGSPLHRGRSNVHVQRRLRAQRRAARSLCHNAVVGAAQRSRRVGVSNARDARHESVSIEPPGAGDAERLHSQQGGVEISSEPSRQGFDVRSAQRGPDRASCRRCVSRADRGSGSRGAAAHGRAPRRGSPRAGHWPCGGAGDAEHRVGYDARRVVRRKSCQRSSRWRASIRGRPLHVGGADRYDIRCDLPVQAGNGSGVRSPATYALSGSSILFALATRCGRWPDRQRAWGETMP